MQGIRKTTNFRKAFRYSNTLSTVNKPKEESLYSTITDAEKIVGYPTSFLNLRWLLNDEVANVAMHLRKLIGIEHPLLKTAKKLLLQDDTPSWGLIVLLVSKAAGQNRVFSSVEKDFTSGVLHSQRVLSEITGMIRSSHMLHKSLLNLESSTEHFTDKHFGNKIALLSGDYLLSTSFNELARIKTPELNILMSSALRDLTESQFIGPRDAQNRPLPARPRPNSKKTIIHDEFGTEPLKVENILGNAHAEWTLRNVLGGASLLGKSCQGTLMLAEHSEEFQRTAYLFGKHLALTIQATKEIETINSSDYDFSLVSAPVLFHLQQDPNFYLEIENTIENRPVNWNRIRGFIKAGFGLKEATKLREENHEQAMEALRIFPASDSRAALERILNGTRSQNQFKTQVTSNSFIKKSF